VHGRRIRRLGVTPGERTPLSRSGIPTVPWPWPESFVHGGNRSR
jgi:hypothetical protein